MDDLDLEAIAETIAQIESAATLLIEKARGIQAIECNAKRILASTKMLTINVSDLLT